METTRDRILTLGKICHRTILLMILLCACNGAYAILNTPQFGFRSLLYISIELITVSLGGILLLCSFTARRGLPDGADPEEETANYHIKSLSRLVTVVLAAFALLMPRALYTGKLATIYSNGDSFDNILRLLFLIVGLYFVFACHKHGIYLNRAALESESYGKELFKKIRRIFSRAFLMLLISGGSLAIQALLGSPRSVIVEEIAFQLIGFYLAVSFELLVVFLFYSAWEKARYNGELLNRQSILSLGVISFLYVLYIMFMPDFFGNTFVGIRWDPEDISVIGTMIRYATDVENIPLSCYFIPQQLIPFAIFCFLAMALGEYHSKEKHTLMTVGYFLMILSLIALPTEAPSAKFDSYADATPSISISTGTLNSSGNKNEIYLSSNQISDLTGEKIQIIESESGKQVWASSSSSTGGNFQIIQSENGNEIIAGIRENLLQTTVVVTYTGTFLSLVCLTAGILLILLDLLRGKLMKNLMVVLPVVVLLVYHIALLLPFNLELLDPDFTTPLTKILSTAYFFLLAVSLSRKSDPEAEDAA